MSYQITLTAALDVSHTNCARLVTDAQRPDKKGGPDVAIMIAIRSWRDVTTIDHSNAPTSTALISVQLCMAVIVSCMFHLSVFSMPVIYIS